MNEALRPAPPVSPQPSDIPIVSVVVPTFNERDNVTTLYRRLETAFKDVPWEVVFVDDNSPDGTWQVVRDLSRNDPRVRCIRRIGRR
ncbi:glycosyltransferase, partial [Bradyrhizobium sp.]